MDAFDELWDSHAMQGLAAAVERTTEGNEVVLRLLMTDGNGASIPIEMRGDRIRGVVRDGDRIRVAASEPRVETGLTPRRIDNLTTNTSVTAWRRPLPLRAGSWLGGGLIGGVLAAIGTVVVNAIAGQGASGTSLAPESPSSAPWVVVLLATAILIVQLVRFGLTRRNPLTPFGWAASAGAAIGALAVTLVIGT